MSEPEAESALEQQLKQGVQWLRGHLLNHAEVTFLALVKEYPDHAGARRLLGVTRCKLGRPDDAIADLRAGAEMEPEREVAWCDLAVGLRRAGKLEAAAAARERAVQLYAARPTPLGLLPLEEMAFSTERGVHEFTLVDYPYVTSIRHGAGRPSHPELSEIIGRNRDRYAAFIEEMGELQADFAQIPLGGTYEQRGPFWLNAWFTALDGMALTQMLRRHDPFRFVEIGSGMSTKFARRAVEMYGLRTKLASLDPEPRNEVDLLCDRVVRAPLEKCDVRLFDALDPGDILFLDSSHRAFQGSDVTVFFMEILPRVKPGVIVHIHDIYLPDDYVSGHMWRMWNEQYMLATALLFGQAFEILFPAWYVGQDPGLRTQARAALCKGPISELDLYGTSFWMRKI